MKVYTYSVGDMQHAMPAAQHERSLRLEGPLVEQVNDPKQADVFVVPASFRPWFPTVKELRQLPYWEKREARHVLFDVSDEPDPGSRAAGRFLYAGCPAMFLRCNVRPWMLDAAPNTIAFAWPVEDLEQCVELPPGGFKFDVGFQAWLSSDARKQAAASCQATPGLSCDFATYPDFYGYVHRDNRPEADRRHAEHLRCIRESRIQLCPWSIQGVYPYRAWEAMSGGRVPALILSGHVEPFADEVPYADFCLQIPSEKAAEAGPIIRTFLDRTPDSKLVEMGQLARKWWLARMNSRDWPTLHAYAVEKQARKAGLLA